MALKFHPRAGQIFICDFTGFVPPEITKKRPVVVISPKLPFRSQLVAVVPLSTTAPKKPVPYVFKLSKNYLPQGDPSLECWAKCDLLMNIGLHRLDGIKTGRRQYIYPTLIPDDLKGVRSAVLASLGLDQA